MQDYLHAWERIGVSDLVLSWLKDGVHIPFISAPTLFELPNHKLNSAAELFIQEEINRLLQKGFIKKVYR